MKTESLKVAYKVFYFKHVLRVPVKLLAKLCIIADVINFDS